MSKKIVQTLILLALLVGFPLVSWIYLSDGLNFRLNAIEALQPKAGLPHLKDSLHRDGQILILFDRQHPLAVKMDKVMAHFDDRIDVTFVNYPSPIMPMLRDSLDKVMEMTGHSGDLETTVFLIGQQGKIRRNYHLASDDHLGDLTEHIAFLVPPDPEKDFEFRRELEK